MLRTRATRRCSTAPGRRLAHRRRDLGAAALGDDHAGRAQRLGGAADRAEVLGVLELVEHDDDARAAREELGAADVRVADRLRADALVGVGPAAPRHLGRVDDGHVDPVQPRLARRAADRPDRADRPPARGQQLAHRVAPVDDHSGHELGPVGAVAHLPAGGGDLVAQPVGLGEVALRRGRSSRARASATTSSGAASSVSVEQVASPSTPSISRRSASPGRLLAGVGLADPVEHRGQRRRRVEVVGQRGEEALPVRGQLRGRRAVNEPPRGLADARGRAPRPRRACRR